MQSINRRDGSGPRDYVILTGHDWSLTVASWPCPFRERETRGGKPIDFSDTMKRVLVISRRSSAPRTTTKSTAECHELWVSLLVRSDRSAECTLASGFSTVGFSDPVEAGSFHYAPQIQLLEKKNILWGAHTPASCSWAKHRAELHWQLIPGRSARDQKDGGIGGWGLTSMFNRKKRDMREERKRWGDWETVLPLQGEG